MYVTHRSFAAPALAIRDFFWLYHTYILYYAGVSIMPPRVLASGPKPCGGNNIVLIIFWNFLEMGLLSDFPHTSFNSLQFCWCSWDSWSLLIKRRHTPPCILDLKQGGTSMKIVKVANYRCFVPLCNDDKQWDSGQDLSFFKFPRDEPKVHCTIFRICYLFRVLCFCLSSLVWMVTVW